MSRKRRGFMLGLVLLGVVAGIQLLDPAPLKSFRLGVFDQFQRLSPRPYTPAPVRIIAIDDRSLAELGQWPWPRVVLARLVQRLHELGAAAIVFDAVFAEPDRSSPNRMLERLHDFDIPPELTRRLRQLPDHDQLFAEAIAEAPVVLGFAGTDRARQRRPRLLAGIATAGSNPRGFLKEIPGAIGNLPMLESAAAGQGSFALDQGEGGIVRQVPLLQNIGGTLYPSLALEALRVAQQASTIVLRANDASGAVQLDRASGLQAIRVGALEIPVNADGHIWMHYTGAVTERRVSASDILTQSSPRRAEMIEGHIVLVGATAAGLKDLRATPVTNFQAGVGIHAQAIEQMLLGWHLERPAWAKGAEVSALLIAGALLLWLLSRLGALWSAMAGLLAISAGIGWSWFAFTEHRLLVDPVYPALAVVVVYLTTSSMGYLRAEREKRWVRQAFSSFLSPALVDQLVASPDRLRLGGESRDMTFLFTDIADFTSFTEASDPGQLVDTLNRYLDRMCAIIMDHGGTIDKVVGDGIHAIFNAPLDQPDHPAQAVACALALDAEARNFSAGHTKPERNLGPTRVGINTGTAIVGNFGGRRRFDYTAHGDAVNTAARLESVNRQLGTRVCVAAATVERCPDQAFRPVGELVLKGLSGVVATFIPVTDKDSRTALHRNYRQFYQHLKDGEPGLRVEAEALHRQYPDDPLITLHARRLRRGESGTRIVLPEK